MALWKKIVVFTYLFVLGISVLQLGWLFTGYAPGGIVLTPSASPYIPPFSVVLTVPSDKCEGWSVKIVEASFFGHRVYMPIVHYFTEDGYEMFNYYVLPTSFGINVIVDYFRALFFPSWVAVKSNAVCTARVLFWIPGPIVFVHMLVALWIKLYLGTRRIW